MPDGSGTRIDAAKPDEKSPASINLFDLIGPFCHLVKPLGIATLDHAYRYQLPHFDQSNTPRTAPPSSSSCRSSDGL